MKLLKQNDTGSLVLVLKKLLANLSFPVSSSTNVFDNELDIAVKKFQVANNLSPDGLVGNKTWAVLLEKGYNFKLAKKDKYLNLNEYFQEYVPKNAIYLHHTAGGNRPDYTIDWWETDNKPGKLWRVGTAFVIGRKGNDGDSTFDGVTYRAFKEIHWAHHLGLKMEHNNTTEAQNEKLNATSLAIEICAYGYLHKDSAGKYYFKNEDKITYVPSSEVYTLDRPWRGHLYFQKYTDKQIAECKRLILTLAFIFDIPIPQRTYNRDWFDLNQDAYLGKPGIWTHANVRPDKTDCFPQPEFIAMLNSLQEAAKTFVPTASGLESSTEFEPNIPYNPMDVKNYTRDLEDIEQ